ncbi:hypothetical protein F4805DRAFT_471922 [Annulohypoxylon moriforme]|nr:hypothetical protein F4805DRAFT_471922 [Annulohypoxylon moriforme]
MSLSQNQRDSQPGLELAPSSDPEVLHRPSDPYPQAVPNQATPPYTNGGSLYTADVSGEKVPPPQPSVFGSGAGAATGAGSKKKLWIMIGVLVAVAVIIGAVVGGVVGSKASGNGSKAAENSGSTSSPNNSSTGANVNTTAVRPLTRLSVTGRRLSGNGFTSQLFWQGGDNHIRTSKYTSTGGKWSTPLVFSDLDAKPGTPIPATTYLRFPQFMVYYLDSKNTFRGINFVDDETVPKTDSINTDRPAFTVDDDTQMSAYWPYIIYQNPNSTFHRQVYDSGGLQYFNDTMQGWFDPDVVPLGDNKTGIAVVPTVKEYKKPYAAGIAYRDQDGRLSVFSFGGVDTGISWDTGGPNIPIPAQTSIAAIAVGRPLSNSTNTWILYQDEDNKIQCVYQDDANGWKVPQEVGDADPGTDIACLTESVLDEPQQVLLSEQTDMRRCYYQYKGAIQEKRLTSSTWIDGDTIPMQ